MKCAGINHAHATPNSVHSQNKLVAFAINVVPSFKALRY